MSIFWKVFWCRLYILSVRKHFRFFSLLLSYRLLLFWCHSTDVFSLKKRSFFFLLHLFLLKVISPSTGLCFHFFEKASVTSAYPFFILVFLYLFMMSSIIHSWNNNLLKKLLMVWWHTRTSTVEHGAFPTSQVLVPLLLFIFFSVFPLLKDF